MAFLFDDTIAAVASPPGSAIRAMIRISGPQTRQVFQKLLQVDPFPADLRHADSCLVDVPLAYGSLRLQGRLSFWPNSRSFTGESLAELHLPGVVPLVEEVLEQIFLSGARPAERGEFTLRAFLAGRIDLVQAEAVLGVIDAADPRELDAALSQLGGGISTQIGAAREQLLLHLADLEAGLDFVEEDIDFVSRPELIRRLTEADRWIEHLLSQASNRMISSGQLKVVLAGMPNAGKSTLFNRLVGSENAIVSPIAGTTRDYLTADIDVQGIAIDLIDTAGWETARDEIEEAVAVLREDQFERADFIVWCSPANLSEAERALDQRLLEQCGKSPDQMLCVMTKADLVTSSSDLHVDSGSRLVGLSPCETLKISVEKDQGVSELISEIATRLARSASTSEMVGTTAARCSESLTHARESLQRASTLVEAGEGDELISIELRDVLEHLGRIVGEVYTDDILDRIFSRFCIGK